MKIQIKHSDVVSGGLSVAPQAQYMLDGELAINYAAADPRLFVKLSDNTVGNIPFATHTNTYWHSGNDGASSTLDADLLDGQEGTYYLDFNNFTNVPNLVNSVNGQTGDVTINGTTNLSYTDSTRELASSTGTNVVLPLATTSVSGLMHQSDKSKLDGIESGATADQSAGEILTAIKTVDGANSGLDSDLLDGQEGSYYVNFNNFTNVPTLVTSVNGQTGAVTVSGQTDLSYTTSTRVLASSTGTDVTLPLASTGIAGLLSAVLYTKLTGIEDNATADQTPAELLTAIRSVDGPNSGLDADTLDGQHGSYYLDYNNLTNTPTISTNADTLDNLDSSQFLRSDQSDTMTGALTMQTSGALQPLINSTGAQSDLFFRCGNNSYSTIVFGDQTDSIKGGIRFDTSNNELTLLGYDFTTRFTVAANGDLYSGTSSGNKIWHAGNDGSGTGLDSDTLDGIQASSFLRSDASNVSTGPIAWNGTLATFDPPGGGTGSETSTNTAIALASGHKIAGFYDGYIRDLMQWTYGSPIIIGMSVTSFINGIDLRPGSGNASVNGNYIWHAGNDGSASGLDADTLDGIQGYSLLRSDASDIYSGGKLDIDSHSNNGHYLGFGLYYGNSAWRNTNSNAYGWAFRNAGVTGFEIRVARSASSVPDQTISLNTYTFGTGATPEITANGSKIWAANNDGTGSGLDADTLDGQQGSYYLDYNNFTNTPTGGGSSDLQGYNDYEVLVEFGSDAANTERRIISASLTNTQYSTIGFQIDIIDNNANHAPTNSTSTVEKSTYYVNCVRADNTTLNSPDSVTIKGPSSGDLIRARKVSQGNYEVTVKNTAQWREYRINIKVIAVNGSHTITYRNGDTPSTAAASYTSSSASTNINYFQAVKADSYTANGNTVWHAGNDGSGSGLDADLLDGKHRPNNFGNSSGQSTYITNANLDTGYNVVGASVFYPAGGGSITGDPTASHSGNGYMFTMGMGDNGGRGAQILASSGTNQQFYFRTKTDSGYQAWRKVWHDANDGSGSGLDADTVDGIQASSFVRSDANDTASGQLTFSGGISTNGEDVYTGNGALIANDADGAFANRSGTNIDHIWHDDSNNRWNFCSDTTYKNTGNSKIQAGELHATGSGSVGGTWTIGSELNLMGSSDSNKYLDARVGSNSFHIRRTSGGDSNHEVMARFKGNGAVDLYYDNSIKISTASDGINVTGDINLTGSATTTNQARTIDFTGFDKESTTDFSDRAYIQHTVNTGGHGGSVLVISSRNDSNDGIAFDTHSSSQLKHNSNIVWDAGNDGSGSGLDADNLDGYTWDSSGKNIRGTEIYADNWFRNYNSGEGLYNQATGLHWYSDDTTTFRIRSNQSSVKIRFATSSNNTRGYVYADTASSIGFLNNAHQWGLRYLSNDGNSPNLYFLEEGNETWTGNPGNDIGKIEYHSNRFYIAAGANSNRVCQFRRSGTDVGYWANDGQIYATASNHKVWHAGNDGSGSGLSADDVDGIQGSNICTLDGNQTISGKKTFTSPGISSSLSAVAIESSSQYTFALKHTSNGAGPNITMWEGGQSAYRAQISWSGSGYIRLFNNETSDELRIGNDLQFYTGSTERVKANSDYLYHNSDIRTPIFYDSNNTGYYLNPASHSNLYTARFQGNAAYIRGGSPTLYLQDTNNRSCMIHNNSNLCYILRGSGNDSTSWSTSGTNGNWPFIVNLENNDITCGRNLSAIGNVTAYSSDRRLKQNFKPIESALDKVNTLNGLYFDWKPEVSDLGFTPEHMQNDIGLIAQEVQDILPQAIKPAPFDQRWDNSVKKNISISGKDYMTVQYERLVPLLVEAIKELSVRLNGLQDIIDSRINVT